MTTKTDPTQIRERYEEIIGDYGHEWHHSPDPEELEGLEGDIVREWPTMRESLADSPDDEAVIALSQGDEVYRLATITVARERYELDIGEWGEEADGELDDPVDTAQTWIEIRPTIKAAAEEVDEDAELALTEGDRVFAICVECIVMGAIDESRAYGAAPLGEFPWEVLGVTPPQK